MRGVAGIRTNIVPSGGSINWDLRRRSYYPEALGGVHVVTGGLNKVPSHLLLPLSARVCPVFARYPRWILVGSRGACVAPEPQRGVPFVNTDAHAEQQEEAVHG